MGNARFQMSPRQCVERSTTWDWNSVYILPKAHLTNEHFFPHAFWQPGTSAHPPYVRRTLCILPPKLEGRTLLSQTDLQPGCGYTTTLLWEPLIWKRVNAVQRHGTESIIIRMAAPEGEMSSLQCSSGRGPSGRVPCPALAMWTVVLRPHSRSSLMA